MAQGDVDMSPMSLVSRFHLHLSTRGPCASVRPLFALARLSYLTAPIRSFSRYTPLQQPHPRVLDRDAMSQHTEYVERWMPGFDGHQFYTRTYPATFPKAVVFFVHGFAEHIGRYERAHARFPMQSIAVFAYDQRGYGRTALDAAHKSKDASYAKTSWNLAFQDIEFFAKHVANEFPGIPMFMMGQSAVCCFTHLSSTCPLIRWVNLTGRWNDLRLLHAFYTSTHTRGHQALLRRNLPEPVLHFDQPNEQVAALGRL